MNCKQCGAKLADGAAFCQACGAPQASGMAAAAAPKKPQLKPAVAPDADDAEQVVWEGKFSHLAMIGSWAAAAALTLAVVVVGILMQFSGAAWMYAALGTGAVWVVLLLRLLYQQLSIGYRMTNQRLVHEKGILWRHTDRIEAIDIDDVTFTQGPFERMLGVGTVKIASSDQSTPLFYLVGIEDCSSVATMIDDIRRKERRKRGVHIETV